MAFANLQVKSIQLPFFFSRLCPAKFSLDAGAQQGCCAPCSARSSRLAQMLLLPVSCWAGESRAARTSLPSREPRLPFSTCYLY